MKKIDLTMEFRIADTFTDSLARLTGEEQKGVKTTAFDLQINPANPGMSFHKLDKARDKNFWSVRAGSDIRLIVHKSDASLLLCYVDHHDKAYDWAERRKLEVHPKTGAAQWVEIRETVQEIVVPAYVQSAVQAELVLAPQPPPALKPLFAGTGPTMNCSAMECPPSGSMTSSRRLKTRCWPCRITFPPRRPRRCLNWRRVASRACRRNRQRQRTPSTIPMRNAASA